MNADVIKKDPASYRDPSGFIFRYQDKIYRQVNISFAKDFDAFISSGLYDELVSEGLIIPHVPLEENISGDKEAYLTLAPEQLPFVSYPYEWTFDMLKEAALLTLEINKRAMAKGMILKDASAFNVQYHKGRMTFIDTLSFEIYDPAQPWIAYRQFCEHFLSPLAMMHYAKMPLQPILLAYPDGIPLDIASQMLPRRTKFNLHLYLHIHLHAGYQHKKTSKENKANFSAAKLQNITKSLHAAIRSLQLKQKGTWSDYYDEAAARQGYLEHKKELVSNWINDLSIKRAIDLGANDGTFSRILAGRNIFTISADGDHFAVNKLFSELKDAKEHNIHPLYVDLSYPAPSIGINNNERASLKDRVQADMVLALAVIHHLAIGRNIPFDDIATFFLSLGRQLIVEFVPKEDPKVQAMLAHKKDIYNWYSEENFGQTFRKYYRCTRMADVGESGRTLYLMHAL